MQPWKTLEAVDTDEGKLELRQRGDSQFLIVIDGRVLMTSAERRSEEALSTLALAKLANRSPRVLIGGLGMGYTLRAALDVLPKTASVVVAELTPAVAAWCKGPLATLTNDAASDPRVTIVIDDVSKVIGRAKGEYDAILIDLYEGPNPQTQDKDDPFYGRTALARTHAALVKNGVFSVWSEDADDTFAKRFATAGFEVSTHRLGSSRRHFVYLGVKS
ncbi:MAG: spermidine synthase [Myxococcota bacterium]|nr:spermidine synthase [Deltaproteobacteria bacterium]MDQ3341147.1 spermidine synthase [Myxococcota bacterium]